MELIESHEITGKQLPWNSFNELSMLPDANSFIRLHLFRELIRPIQLDKHKGAWLHRDDEIELQSLSAELKNRRRIKRPPLIHKQNIYISSWISVHFHHRHSAIRDDLDSFEATTTTKNVSVWPFRVFTIFAMLEFERCKNMNSSFTVSRLQALSWFSHPSKFLHSIFLFWLRVFYSGHWLKICSNGILKWLCHNGSA